MKHPRYLDLPALPAFLAPLLLLCSLLLAPVLAPAAADNTWRLVSDKNGIQVYMRHTDDSPMKTFRGVTRVRIDNLHAISAVLNDTENLPRWMHFVNQAREFHRTSYLNRQMQFLTDVPWPVTDREAVVKIDVSYDVAKNSVYVRTSNAPDLLPPTEGYVRFPRFNARLDFIIADPKTHMVEITYEVIADLGGNLPAWLVNMAMKDTPYFTLDKLRRVVQRPEYQAWRDPVLPFPW